jgi:pantoate--beta-alanine ligase
MSIFVNPLQFGPTEDFSRYPRTFEADLAKASAAGVNFVYAPTPATMYPPGFETHVAVEHVTRRFEGQFRPTHFQGVTTVVLKLFMAIGPCVAVFGRKDYQQWKTLERMTIDLDLPVEVIGAPILRDADGLAMSSRNRYLASPERARALAIVRGLRAAYDAHAAGLRNPSTLSALVRQEVACDFDRIDYVESAAPDSLGELTEDTSEQVLLVAAYLGTTRLIDNLCLGRDSRP